MTGRKPAAYACIVDGAWLGAWKHEIDAQEAGFATEKRFDLLPLYFSEEIYRAMDARRAGQGDASGSLQKAD